MLCYQALEMKAEFEKAKTAYEFYQIDESAPEVTRNFRLKNPGVNLMTQAVKTHTLILNNE
jgi:glutaredoxin-related protein